MAYRLAIASTASCTAGVTCVGGGVWQRTWELAAVGGALLTVGVAGLLAALLRHTLSQADARTRHDLGVLAEQRKRLELDMRAREADLTRREQALARSAALTAMRLGSHARAVDEARDANAALRARNAQLMQEIEEVNDERNQLITSELSLARDRFTTRTYGGLRAVVGSEQPRTDPRARAGYETRPPRSGS
ncbi:hypothetical protein AB0912_31955 [Streptomyces sp. NPDC007084]|uniref:hypothetical protein n=1 Tax=Streptomyces sp. NPDC007084 TaxID=3154313 RepID=UPI003455DB43